MTMIPRPPNPSIPKNPSDCSQGIESSDTDLQNGWTNYFDKREIIDGEKESDKFMTYFGGDWTKSNPLLILFHGAGHSACVWSLLAKLVEPIFRIAAFDARGHGLTECAEPNDLSISRLVSDGVHLTLKLRELAERLSDDHSNPMIVVCGHSLGGSVAARVAADTKIVSLISGCVLLDVVETASLESLHLMDGFVAALPKKFHSIQSAVNWSASHTVANKKSAVVSIPQQVKKVDDHWEWITDLAATRPYWEGWFKGLVPTFLSLPCARILMIAGGHHDRLDTELTVAHMQGKFQLESVPKSGHIIQEDQPEQVALILTSFAKRLQMILRLNQKPSLS